jgi:hypothetical protein
MSIRAVNGIVMVLLSCYLTSTAVRAQKPAHLPEVEWLDLVETNTATVATNGVSLSLWTDRPSYWVHEPVILHITLAAIGQKDVFPAGETCSACPPFVNDVYVLFPRSGRRSPKTAHSEEYFANSISLRPGIGAQPGRDLRASLDINREFDMTVAGDYRIFIRREFALYNPKQKVERKLMLQTSAIKVQIVDQPPDEQVAQLKEALDKARIPISDLECDCKSREISLHLEGPAVRDITPLTGFNIHRLILHNTAVTDLSPLKSCSVTILSLLGSPVRDLSPLEGSGVTWLDLRGTAVTNFSSLAKMPRLNSVFLTESQIMQDVDLFRGLKALVFQPKNGTEPLSTP